MREKYTSSLMLCKTWTPFLGTMWTHAAHSVKATPLSAKACCNQNPQNTQWVSKCIFVMLSIFCKPTADRIQMHPHTWWNCFYALCAPLFHKSRQEHGSWRVTQSGVGLTAINNPERNQIWRSGGGNWWDHTYPYACACMCVSQWTTCRRTKGSDPRKWRWKQSDIMQTSRQTRRQNSGEVSRSRSRLSEGCELRLRRLSWGGSGEELVVTVRWKMASSRVLEKYVRAKWSKAVMTRF